MHNRIQTIDTYRGLIDSTSALTILNHPSREQIRIRPLHYAKISGGGNIQSVQVASDNQTPESGFIIASLLDITISSKVINNNFLPSAFSFVSECTTKEIITSSHYSILLTYQKRDLYPVWMTLIQGLTEPTPIFLAQHRSDSLICFQFQGTISIESMTINSIEMCSVLITFGSDGKVRTINRFYAQGGFTVRDLVVNERGCAIISVTYGGQAWMINSDATEESIFFPSIGQSGLIIKISPEGQVISSTLIAASATTQSFTVNICSIAISINNSLILGGLTDSDILTFYHPLTQSSQPKPLQQLTNCMGPFIARYDENGKIEWVKNLSINWADNIYSSSGRSDSSINITSNSTGDIIVTSQFGDYWYLQLYRSDGELVWSVQIFGVVTMIIDVNYQREIVCVGSYDKCLKIGSTNGTVLSLSPYHQSSFLAIYDEEGRVKSVSKLRGHLIKVQSLAIDSSNRIYVGGITEGKIELFSSDGTHVRDIPIMKTGRSTGILIAYVEIGQQLNIMGSLNNSFIKTVELRNANQGLTLIERSPEYSRLVDCRGREINGILLSTGNFLILKWECGQWNIISLDPKSLIV